MDLTIDIEEAEAEGGSAEDVLGSSLFDPRGFAAAWASARGVTAQSVAPAPSAPLVSSVPTSAPRTPSFLDRFSSRRWPLVAGTPGDPHRSGRDSGGGRHRPRGGPQQFGGCRTCPSNLEAARLPLVRARSPVDASRPLFLARSSLRREPQWRIRPIGRRRVACRPRRSRTRDLGVVLVVSPPSVARETQ